MRTTFLWSMIASFALAAALGIIAIIFDGLGRTGERVIITALIVGAFSLTCLAAAFVLERHRAIAITWVGIVGSVLAAATWLLMVWIDPSRRWEEWLVKIAGTLTAASIWAPHLGLLLLLKIDRHSWRLVRTVTLWLATLLTAFIVLIVWGEWFEDWSGKTVGVLSILTACGTVVSPILAFIERLAQREAPAALGRAIAVQLACPRCHAEQTLAVGRRQCVSCGLRIELRVEEPRCACGYLLYQLDGDRCPECGRNVADVDRWLDTGEPEAADAT
ncbi:MAG: hypothetical protein HKO59_02580 [Phycisphaerales bacterium]|nr:hypothetical protein [Phycisphaerales bacterium]NNM24867.1 hypothetical protein [Phycisphaerales bacterium]